jgi:hypothetical protein
MTAEEINRTTWNRKDAKNRSTCKVATPCIQAAEGFSHKQAWVELRLNKKFCGGMMFKLRSAKLCVNFITASESA